MKFICESMHQDVLAGDKTVFRGMKKSPSDQMLQDTFHQFIRSYLSDLFKKTRCWPVCLYTWFVLGMYLVHTSTWYILDITGTNMYQTHFNFPSGLIRLAMPTSLRRTLLPVKVLS